MRTWLEDTLRRIPTEKRIDQLLPGNWQAIPATGRHYTVLPR
ncbi:MAG: transposase domain-containing protein [Bacteroidales bacterium]|nr:transposase domain-containing protein [Bacteroidales bacterium]